MNDAIPHMNSEDFAHIFPDFNEAIDIQSMNMECNIKQESNHGNLVEHLQQQQQQEQELQPTPPQLGHLSRIPNLDEIPTAYDFEVLIPENGSIIVNQSKLYIKRNSKMTIDVKYRRQYRDEELYLRAMLIFSKPAEMHMPVKRCANHRSNININQSEYNPAKIREIRSKEANILKINDPKAIYFGDEEGETFQERLSIVVPLESKTMDENEKTVQSISLEFLCLSSCTSGINRRPSTIVFTLENSHGELIGKSGIEFKVCSCIKRDSERDQAGKKGKRESNEAFPRGKRPKYDQPQFKIKPDPEPESESDSGSNHENNTHNVAITPISIGDMSINLPTELIRDFLKSTFNVIAGKMAEDAKHSRNYDVLEKAIKDIKKLRKRFNQSE